MSVSARRFFYVPSAETVRKTDAVMALTDRGICPFCKRTMTDETCPCWDKENS